MRLALSLFIAYGILAVVALRDFLVVDATTVIGLAVLPLSFLLNNAPKLSNRWALAVLFFGVFSAFLPSYTLFFLTIIAAVLWLWESQIGRLSSLPFLIFLTISPLFRYFTDVFSFDLRLKITAIAAKIMSKIDPSVSAVGNVIRLGDGADWQIDEACMGLNMLGLSLVLTYFFIAFFYKKSPRLPSNRLIFSAVLMTLLLNCLANLTRIIVLVFLKIYPETIGHEVVGLLSLAVYVLLPLFFLIQFAAKKGLQPIDNQEISKNIPPQYFGLFSKIFSSKWLHVALFLGLVLRGVGLFYQKQADAGFSQKSIEKAGFETKILKNGVCQLQNDTALVYIKTIPNFFTTEHSPMICWRGSGYVFKRIERTRVGEMEVYTGILEKNSSQIHAAWWFSDGHGCATIDQTVWRWRAFTEGVDFQLVNVNAESREDVLNLARLFLKN